MFYHTLASVWSGLRSVSLFRRRLLTCSSTRAKWWMDFRQSFCCRDETTSPTLVVESYLNDLVWPFSKKTLSTFGISGTPPSPPLKAEACKQLIFLSHCVLDNLTRYNLFWIPVLLIEEHATSYQAFQIYGTSIIWLI